MNRKAADDIKLKILSFDETAEVKVIKSDRVINYEVVVTMPAFDYLMLCKLINVADFHSVSVEPDSGLNYKVDFVIY